MCLNTRSNRVIMSKGFTLRNNRRKQVGPEWAVKKKKKDLKKWWVHVLLHMQCVLLCACVCAAVQCQSKGRREQRGSIIGLCVAQIVLFSGKVETQHSSPEVWLPGEREGKKRKKEKGKKHSVRGRQWKLHRCGERKYHETCSLGTGNRWKLREMNPDTRQTTIWLKSQESKMGWSKWTHFWNVLHEVLPYFM